MNADYFSSLNAYSKLKYRQKFNLVKLKLSISSSSKYLVG